MSWSHGPSGAISYALAVVARPIAIIHGLVWFAAIRVVLGNWYSSQLVVLARLIHPCGYGALGLLRTCSEGLNMCSNELSVFKFWFGGVLVVVVPESLKVLLRARNDSEHRSAGLGWPHRRLARSLEPAQNLSLSNSLLCAGCSPGVCSRGYSQSTNVGYGVHTDSHIVRISSLRLTLMPEDPKQQDHMTIIWTVGRNGLAQGSSPALWQLFKNTLFGHNVM